MKIKAPLINYKETEALCKAGADELFCGFEPKEWQEVFSGLEISQRSREVNLQNLSDLKKAISISRRYNSKVHVALNAFFYLDKQYKALLRIIDDVASAGADGLIIADPTMIKIIKSRYPPGMDIIAGTDALIFNSSSASFYKRLGVSRIVLPRSMTTLEIKALVHADRQLEFEAFIMNDLCFFEDGLCAFCKEQSSRIEHRGGIKEKKIDFFSTGSVSLRGSNLGCRGRFQKERIFFGKGRGAASFKKFSFWNKPDIHGCGACSLFAFYHMGLTSVKILDRNMPLKERVHSINFIRKCLKMLQSGIKKKEYSGECRKLYKKFFKKKCSRYNCYYPDAS